MAPSSNNEKQNSSKNNIPKIRDQYYIPKGKYNDDTNRYLLLVTTDDEDDDADSATEEFVEHNIDTTTNYNFFF